MILRVSRLLKRSVANGPGERFVVWVQGCSLACPGCFNPEALDPAAGAAMPTAELAARVHAVAGLRGVTLSGGEPLEQPEAVSDLLARLDPRLDRVLFTGFTWKEATLDPRRAAALRRVDLVVAGRYDRARAPSASPWSGAGGKELRALTGRVAVEEFPECRIEAQIRPDGSVALTGFPPPGLAASLGGE